MAENSWGFFLVFFFFVLPFCGLIVGTLILIYFLPGFSKIDHNERDDLSIHLRITIFFTIRHVKLSHVIRFKRPLERFQNLVKKNYPPPTISRDLNNHGKRRILSNHANIYLLIVFISTDI